MRISREAVSRHIRVLEENLGVKLFERLHRAVALTPAGTKLQVVVRESLEDIAYVSGSIRAPKQAFRITVSATIAISSFWLTPRLKKFRARHPNIEIHAVVGDQPKDLYTEEVDVGLRYGDGNWQGLRSIRLFDIDSFPVCTPDYLEQSGGLTSVAGLPDHTLINLDGVSHSTEDWWWWLNANGVRVPGSFNVLGSNSYDNVIQLALNGEGVALGFSGLIDDLLASGRLVRPLGDLQQRVQSVYAVVPTAMSPMPQVTDFIDWIVEEAQGGEVPNDD